jgi:hypothetical protein
MKSYLFTAVLFSACLGCSTPQLDQGAADQPETAPAAAAEPEVVAKDLDQKPVYEMLPAEIGVFVGRMQQAKPVLSDRVVAIARQNLGQPYKLYLLGEFPFEVHDSQPLCSIANGDCVVFAEHVYAMALANDWQSFFAFLQRIRYKNGEISAVTRNHYTLADWNENNSWLIRDLTPELEGKQNEPVVEIIKRREFFHKNFGLEVDVPLQRYTATYVPAERIKEIAPKLRNGDCVNVIRGKQGAGKYCGHVGLITLSEDGTVNLLHSTTPKSVEQPLVQYVEDQLVRNKQRAAKGEVLFEGMKFLRLQDDPLANLLKVDGPDAPVVTGPKGIVRKMLGAGKT